MSEELLERTFIAIREHKERKLAEGVRVTPSITLHGGEPLALPLDYLHLVMDSKEKHLGPDTEVVVQTNGYALSDSMIEFLKSRNIGVGVSYDHVSGVRVSVSGKETEYRVRANMARLREAGMTLGGISVLAKHNVGHLREVYDFYKSAGIRSFRFLPLFEGPDERNRTVFDLTQAEIVAGLKDLFLHWMDDGATLHVKPLTDYLIMAVRHTLGLECETHERSVWGDGVILVNTNGELYTIPEAYEKGRELGNLGISSIGEILDSEAYDFSLVREEALQEQHCRSCKFENACSAWPLLSSRAEPDIERCPDNYALVDHICGLLTEWGYSDTDLRGLVSGTDEKSMTQPGSVAI